MPARWLPRPPAPAVNGSDDDVVAPDKGSFGFLRLVAPKKEFYVGELVPVELKAFFRAGVELRVDGLPRLNSDAFTMNKLGDQPARGQQVIGGVPYIVLTWSTALTAVKAGEYEMSVEIPTTVTVRQRVHRPRSGAGDPFGDPFFDEVFNDAFFGNFFGTATQKEIALSSQPSAVKILWLPTENRPASFTGAVGRFELTAEAAPTRTAAGDPVTLKLKITGKGKFDRVIAPALEKRDSWKTYKPSAKFEAEDSAGYSGAKNFEQALVPMQSGKVEIPALAFSFFDAETKQYVTRSTSPVDIEVAPGQTASVSVPQTRPEPGAASATPPAVAATPGMVPNQLVPGRFTATLRPCFLHPWLAMGSLLPSVALLAVNCSIRRQQRRASDPERLREANTRRAIQAQLKNMESAAAQGAVSEFFAAARGALQNRFGLLWRLPQWTITLADVNFRMNGETEGFRIVFELADEVTYTGRTFPPRIAEVAQDRQRRTQETGGRMTILNLSCMVLRCAALCLAHPACAGDQLSAFDAANQAFSEGRSVEAVRGYECVIATHGYSAPVLFNLANAQLREGKTGAAILNYERAPWLAPRDPDIAANLRLALQRANLPIAAPAWPLRCASWFSLNGWAGLGVVCLLLFTASLPLAFLAPKARPVLRVVRASAAVTIFISVIAVGTRWGELDCAVVTAKEATARISPVTMGRALFTLPEGSLASIVKFHGAFALVRNLEGHQGWVSRDAITPLLPSAHNHTRRPV